MGGTYGSIQGTLIFSGQHAEGRGGAEFAEQASTSRRPPTLLATKREIYGHFFIMAVDGLDAIQQRESLHFSTLNLAKGVGEVLPIKTSSKSPRERKY